MTSMACLHAQMRSSADTSAQEEEEIAPVEMLLEAYFMLLDNTWNKLQTLKVHVYTCRPGQGRPALAGAAGPCGDCLQD